MVDWSSYPRDGIEAISQRIDNGVDYVRFRSVCSLWRSAAPKKPQFPWLALRHTGDDGETTLGLYDFPNPHFFKPLLPNGIDKDKRICGCSRGWICILDSAPSISLHNPFTRDQIQLPSFPNLLPQSSDRPQISKIDEGFLINGKKYGLRSLGSRLAKKVILSSDPIESPDNCVVMGLMHLGKRLLVLLPGSDRWILSPRLTDGVNGFNDILFYKGLFYAVSGTRLFICDPTDNAMVTEIPPANLSLSYGCDSPSFKINKRSYLVESSGDLLLVITYHDSSIYACEVYCIDLSGGLMKPTKLKNLNNHSLFLGLNSMSVSAENFFGCVPNRIYSIVPPSLSEINLDSGPLNLKCRSKVYVFDMEESTNFISTLSDDTHGNWTPAHWLTPSLCYKYGATNASRNAR